MERARNGKRKASVVSEADKSTFLIDDLKLDTSFLNDDLLDIPNLGSNSILTLDSASDAFPGLELFNGDGGAGVGAIGAVDDPLGLEDLFASDDELADFLPGGGSGLNKVSPSTSESGNINEGRGGLQPIMAAAAGAESNASEPASRLHNANSGRGSGADASNPSNLQEDEAKRLARMQRNRENAYLSRQRKKQQMAELQQTCTQLRGQATQLTCLVHRLVAENCLLRHHLGAACQKASIPVPDVPSAMKPATAPVAAAAPAAAGVAPMAGTVKQENVFLRPGVMPMAAAAQQQQPALVAPRPPVAAVPQQQQAAAPAAAAAPPATTASGRPVRAKRARITGAGAAFLTLFSIFLFVGPMAPLTGRSTTSSSTSGTAAIAAAGYLPPAGGIVSSSDHQNQQLLGPITRSLAGGRSLLQAASIEDSSSTIDPLPVPALSPSLVQQTLDALLQDPLSGEVSAEALQRLKDLAPAAVVLDPNDNLDDSASSTTTPGTVESGNPLAASTAFPMLANSFFKAAGLDAPQTCQKVFEFDASTLPHPTRSRRSVERFITGAYGFKGRSIGLPSLPSSSSGNDAGAAGLPQSGGRSRSTTTTPLRLPSASVNTEESSLVLKALENEQRLHDDFLIDGDGDHNKENSSTDLLPVAVNEPTLVSVLLPSNTSSQSGKGGLSAVDRVFVVLLHPGERFITYSCGLSRPLLV